MTEIKGMKLVNPDELPEVLTAEETAAYLRMTMSGLYNLRHRGEGPPAAQVGKRGKLRFRRREVDRWLAAQEQKDLTG